MQFRKSLGIFLSLLLFLSLITGVNTNVQAATAPNAVVINEVAWMGTTVSYNNEWIELYNTTTTSINLSGWTLIAQDGAPSITLTGTIPAGGYFLLERTSDATVSGITANQIYTGVMGNTLEYLELKDTSGAIVDSVNNWYAGDNTTKATMERTDALASGLSSTNWVNATAVYAEGFGTPKAKNSSTIASTKESINTVSTAAGAINVYFNKPVLTQYATTGNKANYNVNLENKLIERINSATKSVVMATYELNLGRAVDALINKAAQGVPVQIVADAKNPGTDLAYLDRYNEFKLYLEKCKRGKDGKIGTADDIRIFADSAMLAVEDSALRSSFGLPTTITDIPRTTVTIGSTAQTGYMIADGEKKVDGTYYSGDDQMHNKFVITDSTWVFTGSWNFTITDTYGSDENMQMGILGGNTNNVIEINSTELANIYKTEFNEMWGSSTLDPNPVNANFHSRKIDNTTHVLYINGKKVEVYFSPGDNAMDRLISIVKNEANVNAFFSIFAFSSQALCDELKYKWEGSYTDMQGTKTGFNLKGIFENEYWNQYWSANIDMTGRTQSQITANHPNTRYANPAPVYMDKEDRKLHTKTMIVDYGTTSDPTVIAGSTNWSANGEDINDENMLIIHDANITNQFYQALTRIYQTAGGIN